MRMLLTSSFDTYTGYGNDAVDMAVQFQKMGIDLVPWPEQIAPGLPKRFTDLLTKNPGGAYDVSLMFAPPFDIHPDRFAPLGRTAVGWSMWEKTPLIREDMKGHGWKNVGRRERWWSKGPRPGVGVKQDWLDLMVVTCPDNVPAFRNLDDGLPYAVCPNGIDPERFPVVDRSGADRPMTFASVGMLAGRKDPFATLEAWRQAKEEWPDFGGRLILKTSCPGLHPLIENAYPDVTIINEVWSQKQLVDFYSHVDVLVSTSRGEGNNKPAMEFMSTGGPVIASDWSGHRNWLHEDTGYPLPGTLVANDAGVSDFRVDIKATKQAFLDCWDNPSEVLRKGKLSADVIRRNLSWEKVCERFMGHVSRVM